MPAFAAEYIDTCAEPRNAPADSTFTTAAHGLSFVQSRGRIVDYDVAALRKADADDEVAGGVEWPAGLQQVPAGRQDHGDPRRDPVLDFRKIVEPRDVASHAFKASGKSAVTR